MYATNISKNKGFTLMEAMVTVAILGILSSIAAPSFQSYIAHHQTANITSELFSNLRSLRQQAMSQASNIVFCSSTNLSTCLPDASDDTDWTNGWIAFSDLNQNNQRDTDTEDIIILQTAYNDGSLVFSGGGVLSFNYLGETNSSEQFNICSTDNDSELSRAIIVNNVGRAQSVNPSQLNSVISCI